MAAKVLGKHFPQKTNSGAPKMVNTLVALEGDAPLANRDFQMLCHIYGNHSSQ